MTNLPKLVTTNLDQTERGGEKTRSSLQSPSLTKSPLSSNDSKSRERKFKGVIDKFMGNFNGESRSLPTLYIMF
jgi:hypothetical protein